MQTSRYLFIWHESITALQPDGGPGNCCVLEDFPQWNTAVLLGVTTIPTITPGAGERKGGVDFIWISLALSFPFFIPCYNISDATWDPATLRTKQTKGLFPCTEALQNKVQGLQRKHSPYFKCPPELWNTLQLL